MKINWGTSIVIAFALFMAFILFFVFKVQGNHKYDNELVVEEYYKQDAKFGQQMSKLQNASDLKEKPLISLQPQGVMIDFPLSYKQDNVSGTISFYRPSSKKLDFSLPIQITGQSMIVPKAKLADGVWHATLYWKFNGAEYMVEQQLYIK